MKNIYVLKDKDLNPFYVGQTINPKNRFLQHKKTYGNDIFLEIITSTDDLNKANELESEYIKHYHNLGYNMKNANFTGYGHPSNFYEESVILGIRVPKSKKEMLKKKFDKIVSKYKNKPHES